MNPFFDSIIIAYLIASSAIAVAVLRDRKRAGSFEARHPRLTTSVALLSLLSFLVVFWGSFIEPRIITVNRVSIDFPNFEPTKPVRVALISDVHVGTYKQSGWLTRVVARIKEEKPDLVLIAGDIVVNEDDDTEFLFPFSELTEAIPTYAVLGDHDYNVDKKHGGSINEDLAQSVDHALRAFGVRVMKNESVIIEKNNAQFTLIGLDDWLANKTRTEELKNISTKEPILVLIHNPDFILDPESKKADLIVAGNTHGGQIRLPFIGPVPRLPSKLPRSFDEGLFDVGDHTKLFITSGIGESGPRARLFNPPEIVILELH